MKHSFLFFLVIIGWSPVFSQSLPIDPETKKVTYWEVVEVDGATKDDLYKRAKNFGTVEKGNILKEDPEKGVYSTKSKINVTYPSPMKGLEHSGIVEYVMTIFCKDGRYKYVLTDFNHKSPKGNGGDLSKSIPACGKYTLVPAGWAAIKKSTDEQMKQLIEGIKNGMKNPAKNSASSNDW